MMSTAPPLVLTREQASRLHGYIQVYRRYAFTSIVPSTGRNTTLRVLQAMQGKLVAFMDQHTPQVTLTVTMEELTTLQTTIEVLRLLYFQEPATEQLMTTRADLAGLKAMLEAHARSG